MRIICLLFIITIIQPVNAQRRELIELWPADVPGEEKPQKKEGALQDIQRAIRLVRKQSEKWNLDPGKTGIIGFEIL